jgi:DivIVA domain-containing protein
MQAVQAEDDVRGAIYRSRLAGALLPAEVRGRQFNPAPLGRRGYAPGDVDAFLIQMATELGALYCELGLWIDENERLKKALRDWQAMHSRECGERVPRVPRESAPC